MIPVIAHGRVFFDSILSIFTLCLDDATLFFYMHLEIRLIMSKVIKVQDPGMEICESELTPSPTNANQGVFFFFFRDHA